MYKRQIFVFAVGWCLLFSWVCHHFGLSYEIGAFIAGVLFATSPIARHIAEQLKPVRDFFLVMFFFALGAGLDLQGISDIALPALLIATAAFFLKYIVFNYFLIKGGETPEMSQEISIRLSQVSEFSILLAVIAFNSGVVLEKTSNLVQLTAIISFLISSYIIQKNYPNPSTMDSALHKD